MVIDAKVQGLEKLKQEVKKQVQALQDMTGFYRTVGRHMVDETVRDRFGRERAPDGTPWQKWSHRYAERMRAKGKGGNKILSDTGELRRSIHFEASQDKAVIGTNLVYARAHQFGIPQRNLPARPFLGLNDRDKEWILKALKKYLNKKKKAL